MTSQLLNDIEELDRRIDATDAADAPLLGRLLEQRAQTISKLCTLQTQWLPSHIERLAVLGKKTDTMRARFQFLHSHAVDAMALHNRHDRLLHLISGTGANPCYVDYSG